MEWNIIQSKMNKTFSFVTVWRKPDSIMLSKMNPIEKDKYCITFTYTWNLQKSSQVQRTYQWLMETRNGK